MSVALDVEMWAQRWHKVDPRLQHEFLSMQLKYSQASSFHDIPVIMYTVIGDPLKRKLLAASSTSSSSSSSTTSTSRMTHKPVAPFVYPCFTYLRCFAAVHDLLTDLGDGSQPQSSLHNTSNNADVIPDDVQVLPVDNKETESVNNISPPKPTWLFDLMEGWAATIDNDPRNDNNGGDDNVNYYASVHHDSPTSHKAEEVLVEMCSKIVTSFLLIREEHDTYLQQHQDDLRRNEGKFTSSNMPENAAAVSTRFNVVQRVLSTVQHLDDSDTSSLDKDHQQHQSITHAAGASVSTSTNRYTMDEGPSMTKEEKLYGSVRWAARHLLDNILGLQTLKAKELSEGMPSINPVGEAVPPIAGMMYVLCNLWESDKVANRCNRSVIDSWERRGNPSSYGGEDGQGGNGGAPSSRPLFSPMLQHPTKVYAVSRVCSSFCFALYALMVSPKTQFLEILPHSLQVSGIFFTLNAGKKSGIPPISSPAPTAGLLSNLLSIKASYHQENPSEALWKQRHMLSSPPHQTIQMMIRQMSRLLSAHLPDFMAILDMWSAISDPDEEDVNQYDVPEPSAVLTPDMAAAGIISPGHSLLVDACRSWLETLFGVPNVPRTAANIYEAEQRNSKGITDLLSPVDKTIFWTHFTAFGWPFVIKLCLQIITEAFLTSSQVPTLQGSSMTMYGRGLKLTDPEVTNPYSQRPGNDRFAAILRRSNMVRDTPSDHLPVSPFGPYLQAPEKPDGTTASSKRIHSTQRSLVSTINLLPLSTVDFEGCVRRSDQWDAALFFNMKSGDIIDPTATEHMKLWETQFVSASLANSKANSDKFNITKSVDSMCLRW